MLTNDMKGNVVLAATVVWMMDSILVLGCYNFHFKEKKCLCNFYIVSNLECVLLLFHMRAEIETGEGDAQTYGIV
jgi:hypothetical protein